MRNKTLVLLSVFLLLMLTPALAQGDVLTPGVTVTGELAGADAQADYTFEGVAGEIFSVSATGSPAFLKDMIVTRPDGEVLIDIDMRNFSTPRMDTGYLQLPLDGTYRVTLLGDEPTGYELSLQKREPRLIGYDRYYGEEGRDYFYDTVQAMPFTFEGQAGDTVLMSVATEQFDPTLTFVGPGGTELAVDDDSGGNLMPRIGPFTLPESGLYQLLVRAYNPDGSGLIYVSVYSALQPQSPYDISYDQTLTVPLDADNPLSVFRFSAEDGDVLALRVEDPDEVAEVQIEGTFIGLIATTHPNPERPRLHSIDRITLPEGDYSVRVQALPEADLDDGADVQVRLELVGRRSLDFTNLISSGSRARRMSVYMNSKDPVQTFSIYDDGSNGINLVVQETKPVPGPLPAFRVVVTQDGETIASYIMDAVQGLRETEVRVNFVSRYPGLIDVRLELLGDGPVWFSLMRELTYGMG